MYRNFNPYQIKSLSSIMFVREGEGDDGSGAGAGGAGDDLQAKIAAAVAEATKGLTAKRDELLANERKLKDKLKSFDGLDPEKIRLLQERLDQDDDAKLLAEGKKQQVIEKYTERMREQHKSELAKLQEQIEVANKRTEAYRGAVLDNQIRSVCNGLHKGAIEDALLHARQIFTLDDSGNAVKISSDGTPELGKDGKNPFSPAEWIELQKESKPHWFPTQTSGSGSTNAREAGGGNGKTMKRADFDSQSLAKQSEIVRSGVKIID